MTIVVLCTAVPRLTLPSGCNARVRDSRSQCRGFEGGPIPWLAVAVTREGSNGCELCGMHKTHASLSAAISRNHYEMMRDIFSVVVVVRWMHVVCCGRPRNLIWRSGPSQEALRSNICRLSSSRTSIDEAIHSSSGAAPQTARRGPLTGRATGGSGWLG